MNIYEATVYNDSCIELEKSEDLHHLYGVIIAEEDFILQWVEEGELHSQIIIATNISSKVKNGEIILRSKQKNIKGKIKG